MDLSHARWRKSSRSGSEANCVEIAHIARALAVRDSKNPTGPALIFAPTTFATFLTALKTNRLTVLCG